MAADRGTQTPQSVRCMKTPDADAAVAAALVKNLGMTPKHAVAETLRLMKRRGE